VKIDGIELKDAGRKPDKNKELSIPTAEVTESPKISYPYIRCDPNTDGWNLPIDLEGFKVGDRAIFVALVNVKEKTKRESESQGKNESGTTGELEFLKVGLKKQGEEEMPEEKEAKDFLSKIED